MVWFVSSRLALFCCALLRFVQINFVLFSVLFFVADSGAARSYGRPVRAGVVWDRGAVGSAEGDELAAARQGEWTGHRK